MGKYTTSLVFVSSLVFKQAPHRSDTTSHLEQVAGKKIRSTLLIRPQERHVDIYLLKRSNRFRVHQNEYFLRMPLPKKK